MKQGTNTELMETLMEIAGLESRGKFQANVMLLRKMMAEKNNQPFKVRKQ